MKELQEILKKRAMTLALEPEKLVNANELMQIITFSLSSEIYGIESAFVREVYPLKDFTPLPGVPPFVLGIINIRGQILSIINLKKFFGLPEKGLGELNKVIILRNDHMEFGILADTILGTKSILLATIQASIPTITGIGATFLKGVTPEHMIVLDGESILSDRSIVIHQETEQKNFQR